MNSYARLNKNGKSGLSETLATASYALCNNKEHSEKRSEIQSSLVRKLWKTGLTLFTKGWGGIFLAYVLRYKGE